MPLFKYLLLITGTFCILFSGCTRSNVNTQNPSGCDTAILSTYADLVKNRKSEPDCSKRIQTFFRNTDLKCQNLIATDVIHDLFEIAYTSGIYDTTSIQFLNALSVDEKLLVKHRLNALTTIATINLFVNQDAETALVYMKKTKDEEFLDQYNDTLERSYTSVMAQIMMQKSDLKSAAEFYLKSIALSEKLKDSVSLVKSYSNFGILYNKMGEYQKAIEMQEIALHYFERKGDKKSLVIAGQCVGVNYAYMQQYDSALVYYNKSLQALSNDENNSKLRFEILFSIASIYTGKSDYQSALIYYDKAKAIVSKINNRTMERTFIMASTPAYAKLRNVDAELLKIESYLPEFYKANDLSNIKNCYQVLYHTHYVLKDYLPALLYYQKLDSVNRALSVNENKQYIADLDKKYQTEQKILKIKVQQKTIQQQHTLNSFLLALLALVGLGTAFIVTRVKLKRNKKEANLQRHFTEKLLENTEDERKRIARDLHDGVSQELMILKNQVNNNSENVDKKIDLIINEIRMISRDLHPVMLDKIGLKSSIEHSCEQMMELNKLFISAEVSYNNSLEKQKELQVYRIIQEGLNNIIKYANAEAAKVTLLEGKDNIVLRIEDNGQGFDVEEALKSKKSFGIINIMQRSKTLGGKAEITSSSTGTIIKIELPK